MIALLTFSDAILHTLSHGILYRYTDFKQFETSNISKLLSKLKVF